MKIAYVIYLFLANYLAWLMIIYKEPTIHGSKFIYKVLIAEHTQIYICVPYLLKLR